MSSLRDADCALAVMLSMNPFVHIFTDHNSQHLPAETDSAPSTISRQPGSIFGFAVQLFGFSWLRSPWFSLQVWRMPHLKSPTNQAHGPRISPRCSADPFPSRNHQGGNLSGASQIFHLRSYPNQPDPGLVAFPQKKHLWGEPRCLLWLLGYQS